MVCDICHGRLDHADVSPVTLETNALANHPWAPLVSGLLADGSDLGCFPTDLALD